ncbi:hypothetical protein N8576_00685 [bacterium]|nr:hypothetical protein [bacterium]
MPTASRSNKNQSASVYSREDHAAVNGWDGAVGTISDAAVVEPQEQEQTVFHLPTGDI